MRGTEQLERAAQRYGRAIFAFDLTGTDHDDVVQARNHVDGMTRVQQAHGTVQRHTGRMQPEHLAAHAAHRHIGFGPHTAYIKDVVEGMSLPMSDDPFVLRWSHGSLAPISTGFDRLSPNGGGRR